MVCLGFRGWGIWSVNFRVLGIWKGVGAYALWATEGLPRSYMVYGIWYRVHGMVYMVYGIWYRVHGIRYVVYGIWYMVHGIWYTVHGIWYDLVLIVLNRCFDM